MQYRRSARVAAYVPDHKFRSSGPQLTDARRHRRPTDRRKQQYKSKRRWFDSADVAYDEKPARLICPAACACTAAATT